ncbi:MAG: hypothetical protein L0Y79_00075 [Chlorobi bacterium]|nr:hypothetical protein [Chlorobiota bacterium]MCI0716524.1 hypothetical protein [Chlorobiota bacterium]
MINYAFALVVIVSLSLPYKIISQCSDAGVCTLGKPHTKHSKQNTSSITFGYVFGSSGKDNDINSALNDLTFSSLKLEADLDILKNTRLLMSVPYTFVNGPLGEVNGLGDLTIALTRSFVIEKSHTLSFTLGGKPRTGRVNSDDSLPQRYMPSLGTNDLLVGASYSYTNYNVAVAYQKPFGRSPNYITRLKRGDDLLLRAGYNQQFGKVNAKAEILTILRIQPSSVLADTIGGENFVEVDGSNEPQVNLLAAVNYLLSSNIAISGEAALPFLQRDYNYDGLKRSFSFSVSIAYLFNLK